jgi:general nucleoside transport system permease protein
MAQLAMAGGSDMTLLLAVLLGIAVAATPLLLAAIGELVVEKAGVLNLGVEGMMIVGAIAGFAVTVATGNHLVGVMAAMTAGAIMAAIFGVLVLILLANQVAAGLALTIFGLGVSSLLGQSYSGIAAPPFPRWASSTGGWSIDALMVLSLLSVPAVAWFLLRTRAGMMLRAVGENHDAAHAQGLRVIAIRFAALAFGGAMAGLGGAYLSLVQNPFWVEKMTAGRGWIALALVVFAAWRPGRALAGAYIFGAISILQLHSQALGLPVDAQILAMLPYLATILVLVMISRDALKARLDAPGSLGKTFHPSH